MSQIRAGIVQVAGLVSIDPDLLDINTAIGRAYGLNHFLLTLEPAVSPAIPPALGPSGAPVRFSASLVECKIFPCAAR
jgi:hypothetical protein